MPQPMTDQMAVQAARAAVEGMAEIPSGVVPRVERRDGQLVVTFPTNHPVGIRGADYHAQVTLDETTGQVIQILGGQ